MTSRSSCIFSCNCASLADVTSVTHTEGDLSIDDYTMYMYRTYTLKTSAHVLSVYSKRPQFGWTHLTLFILGCQAYLVIQNMFEGLFWFLLPVSMVICNDVMAYFFGEYVRVIDYHNVYTMLTSIIAPLHSVYPFVHTYIVDGFQLSLSHMSE